MNKGTIDLAVAQLSRSRGVPQDTIRTSMNRLLNEHESEWTNFLDALGPTSFVANWVARP